MAWLIFVSLAVYGRVCGHQFLAWDDPQNVVSNRRVDPPTWHGVAESWRRPYWGLYIPVAYTFFAAEAAIARQHGPDGTTASLSPAVFHAGSLTLHIICVLLVYSILRHLLLRQGHQGTAAGPAGSLAADGAAFAGALWFSLHPMQVESVAWISETRGLLCAMFSLLAVRQYLRHAEASGMKSAVGRYLLATLWFGLALLSKPAAVAVPLLVAALDLGLLRRQPRRTLVDLGPWLLMAACVTLATKGLQPGEYSPAGAPLWARPLVAGEAILFYARKTLVPWPLSADYGYTPQWMMQQVWFPVAWLAPLLLLGVVAVGKDRRVGLTCAAVFLFWLVPVLGFVPFDFQRISTVADRYVYLALLGPALALAWLVKRYWGPWAIGASGAVLALYVVLDAVQVSAWHDTGSLFAQVLEANPRSAVARYHLGVLLADGGAHDDEAIQQFREALAERPDLIEIHVALGNTLVATDAKAGLDVLRTAAERFPRSAVVRNNLADVLARQGADDEAERNYRDALRIQPDFADAHLGLARLRFGQKAFPAALEHFREALEIAPDRAEARVGLGATLEATGDREEARRQYLAALRTHPHLATAHFNLGNLFLREPGRLAEAVTHYQEALQSDPFYPEGYVNLGIALGMQGKTREAIAMQRAALRLNPRLVEARVQLGLALAAQGNQKEATAAFRTTLEDLPADSPQARQIRELLRQGTKRVSPLP